MEHCSLCLKSDLDNMLSVKVVDFEGVNISEYNILDASYNVMLLQFQIRAVWKCDLEHSKLIKVEHVKYTSHFIITRSILLKLWSV